MFILIFPRRYDKKHGQIRTISTVVTKVLYKVSSAFLEEKHEVHIGVPRCSCYGFQADRWPCRHIILLIQREEISWNDLPEDYQNYFILDNNDNSASVPVRPAEEEDELPTLTRPETPCPGMYRTSTHNSMRPWVKMHFFTKYLHWPTNPDICQEKLRISMPPSDLQISTLIWKKCWQKTFNRRKSLSSWWYYDNNNNNSRY